ncbi:MAG: nuc hydro protein [Candidatus Hydrogenedentes bacterium]|nr:nuc hydro protein [Candidatus Hydrogenedentota bacterium]
MRYLSILCLLCAAAGAGAETAPGSIPIIYTTDLYHPHQDPDDHFDLATLFALPEFDIRAIVIDVGERGKGRPGIVPLKQMMYLTGRDVPFAAGLLGNLTGPEDTAADQPAESQAGVELILKALRESSEPVVVFVTGSLRDVAAAYNRDPELFKKQVRRLYINAGHADGGAEYNVELDPVAYIRMLTAPLPVFWVPCFGKDGFESLWNFTQADVLDGAPEPLQQFFVYALNRTDPKDLDPIAALTMPVIDTEKGKYWADIRNMWCTAALLHAAGRETGPYAFPQEWVLVGPRGQTELTDPDRGVRIRVFYHEAPFAYRAAMRATLQGLFATMPLKVQTAETSPE